MAALFLMFLGMPIAPRAQADTPPALLVGHRVLWLGDSITQDGRYVTDALYLLDRRYPGQTFDFVSIGLASETASGLTEKKHPFPRPDIHERLERALDKVKPTVVVACYGMNDGIYHPQSPDRMASFQQGIQTLIATVRQAGAALILLTPTPFDPQPVRTLEKADAPDFSYLAPYVGYDGVLSDYARWELGRAGPNVTVIDMHTPISAYRARERQANPGYHDTSDGIHPDAAVHLLMAHVILHALGVPVATNMAHADLQAELSAMNADPLYDLVRRQREARSEAWLAFVGYTRGQTVRAESVDAAEKTAQALQPQIDALRQPIRVACVGDSITFGAFLPDRDKQSYPSVLGRLLGPRYAVSNFGVNGTTLLKKGDSPYYDTPACKDAQAFGPDIVVIMLGANDTKPQNWKYKDDFGTDYQDLAARFAALPSKPRLFLCRPVPVAGPGNYGINEAGVEQEIPVVDAVADDEKAAVIDVHAAFAGHLDLLPDRVHPNAAGAELIAHTVCETLMPPQKEK